MINEVRIKESEYRKLVNMAKLNSKSIDKKAYQIAKKLNKIDLTIEVEMDNYSDYKFNTCINGDIERYCLNSTEYRSMPSDLRSIVHKFDKLLKARVIEWQKPFKENIYRLQRYNARAFRVALTLGIANVVTLLIFLLK